MRRTLTLALVLLSACTGAPDPIGPTPSPTPPPPPIPRFGAVAPDAGKDCFPRSARTRGVPGSVPVSPLAVLQGPDDYAGPYEPLGEVRRRIAGRGFEYEVSSSVGLVAGYYAACLTPYGNAGWTRVAARRNAVLYLIPLSGRPKPVVVLIADDPTGPSAVVIFTDYELTRVAPSPPPSPSASLTGSPAPTPSGTASPEV